MLRDTLRCESGLLLHGLRHSGLLHNGLLHSGLLLLLLLHMLRLCMLLVGMLLLLVLVLLLLVLLLVLLCRLRMWLLLDWLRHSRLLLTAMRHRLVRLPRLGPGVLRGRMGPSLVLYLRRLMNSGLLRLVRLLHRRLWHTGLGGVMLSACLMLRHLRVRLGNRLASWDLLLLLWLRRRRRHDRMGTHARLLRRHSLVRGHSGLR